MIVTTRYPLYRFLSGLMPAMSAVLGGNLLVWLASERLGSAFISVSSVPLTVIGATLSIFLGFRNNAVYERYWEARILWGRLVNASRTLIRQLAQFTDHSGSGNTEARPDRESGAEEGSQAFIQEMANSQIAYVHALRCHLRDQEPWDELTRFLRPEEVERLRLFGNVPMGILQLMGERLCVARRRRWVSDLTSQTLDATLTEMTAVQGGCERIKNSPLPPVYTYFAHKFVLSYCFLLPFGLVKEIGLLSLPVVFLISLGFLTLDRVSYLIETPFGLLPDDLPLSAICNTIEGDILRLTGNPEHAPEALIPQNGIFL